MRVKRFRGWRIPRSENDRCRRFCKTETPSENPDKSRNLVRSPGFPVYIYIYIYISRLHRFKRINFHATKVLPRSIVRFNRLPPRVSLSAMNNRPRSNCPCPSSPPRDVLNAIVNAIRGNCKLVEAQLGTQEDPFRKIKTFRLMYEDRFPVSRRIVTIAPGQVQTLARM